MTLAGQSVVVVGAGMGGLASAIDLALAGAEVTLVEQHSAAGGKMRELRVGAESTLGIDSGPTVFTMRHVFDGLYERAGTRLEDHLKLHKSHTLARHSWSDGAQLDLFAEVELTAQAVEAFAGSQEASAYRRFAEESEQIYTTLDHTFMRVERPSPLSLTFDLVRSNGLAGIAQLTNTRPFVSLWKELGRLFSDPRLQQLFGRYATYCGSSPFAAPATLMLIAHAERAGVWFVDGGMQRLAESLASLAVNAGAELRFNSRAERIETRSGKVSAVVLDDGTRLEADAVVFNGDYAALSQGLVDEKLAGRFKRRQKEPRSLSAITFSLLGAAKGFDLSHHNVFFGDDYRDEFRSIFSNSSVTAKPTIYVCAQDRGDPAAPRPNGALNETERLFLLVNAPPRDLTASEVLDVKRSAFEFLAQHGLEIDVDGDMLTTTPNDYARRFPGSSGSIYGWPTHGWYGSFRRSGSTTPVGGLFMAGGSVHPGPGVPMAALSGRIAAARAMGYLQ